MECLSLIHISNNIISNYFILYYITVGYYYILKVILVTGGPFCDQNVYNEK